MQIHRRCIRWQINKRAQIELAGVFTDCIIFDVGFSGARISLEQKLTQDAFFKLNINLSADLNFQIEAWVAWHKVREGINLYGIYFTKIRDTDKERMFKFVRNNFPEQVNKEWWKVPTEEKGGEKMDDRRIFERFQSRFPLRFIDLKGSREGSGQTKDISAKGIGFMAKDDLKLHTPLEMWLELSDKREPFYARGEVAWSKMIAPNEFNIGVNLERADLMGMSRVLRAA